MRKSGAPLPFMAVPTWDLAALLESQVVFTWGHECRKLPKMNCGEHVTQTEWAINRMELSVDRYQIVSVSA